MMKTVLPNIMVGIEVEIGITLNVMVGVGAMKTIEVMEIKIARIKTNQKQTTKRKVHIQDKVTGSLQQPLLKVFKVI
jgi:hypothetical protein